MLVTQPVSYAQLTANGVVKASPGEFYGVIVIASASGSIRIYDNASAASGTVLYESPTLTTGQIITLNSIGVKSTQGLYMQLVSGTATVNILYV